MDPSSPLPLRQSAVTQNIKQKKKRDLGRPDVLVHRDPIMSRARFKELGRRRPWPTVSSLGMSRIAVIPGEKRQSRVDRGQKGGSWYSPASRI